MFMKMRIKLCLTEKGPFIIMSIIVPENRDNEEYIDELLDTILADPFRYEAKWEFI